MSLHVSLTFLFLNSCQYFDFEGKASDYRPLYVVQIGFWCYNGSFILEVWARTRGKEVQHECSGDY